MLLLLFNVSVICNCGGCRRFGDLKVRSTAFDPFLNVASTEIDSTCKKIRFSFSIVLFKQAH